MKENKKIYVTKNEMKDDWEEGKRALKNLLELTNKIYTYSTWTTNISIALLGFFLAVLLQLKSKDAIFGIPSITLIMSALSISIIIGFFVRIKYEIIESYTIIKSQFSNVLVFMKKILEKFKEKGDESSDIDLDIDLTLPKIESMKQKYPIRLLLLQMLLVIYSIFQISIYLIIYLFFK